MGGAGFAVVAAFARTVRAGVGVDADGITAPGFLRLSRRRITIPPACLLSFVPSGGTALIAGAVASQRDGHIGIVSLAVSFAVCSGCGIPFSISLSLATFSEGASGEEQTQSHCQYQDLPA